MAIDVTAFSALARQEFADGKLAADAMPMPSKFAPFTTNVPSTTRVETHLYMSSLPRLQEFKGYAPATRLAPKEYNITNKEYRFGTVTVRQTDLEDDQFGMYLKSIQAIPQMAQRDIGNEILKHLAAGTTRTCFDETAYFADSHTFGSGDNLMTYNGAANNGTTHKIIALVTTNPVVKPIIFQDRESINGLQDDTDSPEAWKKKEYEFWTDCRFGLGYGYWWDGIHMTITDLPLVSEIYDIVEQIINRFRTFTLPKGNVKDDLLYVHEQWEPTAENFKLLCDLPLAQVLKRSLQLDQFVTSTGNQTNVYQNIAEVIPTMTLNS